MPAKPLSGSTLDAFLGNLPRIRSMGPYFFDPVWARETHATDCVELLYPTQGHVELVTDTGRFKAGPGDILLNPTGTFHRDEFDFGAGVHIFMVFFSWPMEQEFFARVDNRRLQRLPRAAKAEMRSVLEQIRAQAGDAGAAQSLRTRGRLLALLLLALEETAPRSRSRPVRRSFGQRRRRRLAREAKRHLDAHYHEVISLEGLARSLRVSPSYLSHVFSTEEGTSLISYLTALRMNRAKGLLAGGRMNVSEAARAVGYTDANYFSKAFRRFFGHPPSYSRAGG
ncbi:MAG: AraC family transcriptional regulator [Kiritimatiellae bacterium]|nr:AraC family transcriptional regulator [Kiritimatiellia bacterium]